MTDKQIITDDQKNTIHRLQQECTEKSNAIIALGEQLKAKKQECEELKKYKKVVDKLAGMQVILTNEEKMPMLYENAKDLKLKQLSKTLTEIKELIQSDYCTEIGSCEFCAEIGSCLNRKILQKISECEVRE